MGLDFSHGNARFSYGGFMDFRRRIAKEVGIDLDVMFGFYEYPGGVEWDATPAKDDPILALLDHSDCDGDLSPDECRKVATRLREIVASWPESDGDRVRALELAASMEEAAAANEPLIFC